MTASKKLLVIDASYTLEMINERGLLSSVTCRDLDGYFTHVWSLHPLASMLTTDKWLPKFGKPVYYKLNSHHTFVEGRIGRFSFLRHLFPLNFLISQIDLLIELYILIKKNKINVIRVGDPLYLGILGWILAKTSGIPLVIRVNGHNQNIRKNTKKPVYPKLFKSITLEEKIESFIFKQANYVIAPNNDYLDFAIKFGANSERVLALSYGNLLAREYFDDPKNRVFDTCFFDHYNIRKNKYFLTVGRLESIKFPEDVLEAFARLPSNYKEFKLVFVGDGSMKNKLIERAMELNIQEKVIFTGNLHQSDLLQLYTNTLIYLSPLTGRALSEAALCGAPTIAYDLDWQPDIVKPDVTGILIPPRDIEGFTKGMVRYIEDSEFASKMGNNIRLRALEKLDPYIQNQHEISLYKSLIHS